jgi:hypothetical protein
MVGAENGEKELLFAVLERAFRDLEYPEPPHNNSHMSKTIPAPIWIADNGDPEIPFTFNWICNQLSLEPNIVRKELAKKYEYLKCG